MTTTAPPTRTPPPTTTPSSTSTPAITSTLQDRALKAKHPAMWASGNSFRVVTDVVEPLGAILVETLDLQPGQRVLDVAAGTGSSALPAASRGADPPAKVAALDADLAALGDRFLKDGTMGWDYLLVTARRI